MGHMGVMTHISHIGWYPVGALNIWRGRTLVNNLHFVATNPGDKEFLLDRCRSSRGVFAAVPDQKPRGGVIGTDQHESSIHECITVFPVQCDAFQTDGQDTDRPAAGVRSSPHRGLVDAACSAGNDSAFPQSTVRSAGGWPVRWE